MTMEQRIATLELVMQRMIGILEIHGHKLDAILDAATAESGPSETGDLLRQIVTALEEQTETLALMPQVLGQVIRRELTDMDGEEMEMEEGASD